jgi:hypothetical protein
MDRRSSLIGSIETPNYPRCKISFPLPRVRRQHLIGSGRWAKIMMICPFQIDYADNVTVVHRIESERVWFLFLFASEVSAGRKARLSRFWVSGWGLQSGTLAKICLLRRSQDPCYGLWSIMTWQGRQATPACSRKRRQTPGVNPIALE